MLTEQFPTLLPFLRICKIVQICESEYILEYSDSKIDGGGLWIYVFEMEERT